MTWLKIDDIARETGLTKRTIRYYEEIGLIKPCERSEGNMRLYTEEDIKQLKRVIDAKEVLGFSLQELQRFLALREAIELVEQKSIDSPQLREDPLEVSEVARGLQEQVEMLEMKMKKMRSFQAELEELLQKVKALST